MLLSTKEPTDTLFEQTKTKPKETLECNLKKQMEMFSVSPPVNLVEEAKWFLAVTSFEATTSVLVEKTESSKTVEFKAIFKTPFQKCWLATENLKKKMFSCLHVLSFVKDAKTLQKKSDCTTECQIW